MRLPIVLLRNRLTAWHSRWGECSDLRNYSYIQGLGAGLTEAERREHHRNMLALRCLLGFNAALLFTRYEAYVRYVYGRESSYSDSHNLNSHIRRAHADDGLRDYFLSRPFRVCSFHFHPFFHGMEMQDSHRSHLTNTSAFLLLRMNERTNERNERKKSFGALFIL